MGIASQAFTALAILLIGTIAVRLIHTRPATILYLLSISATLNWLFPTPRPLVEVAGTNFFFGDAVVALAGIALLRGIKPKDRLGKNAWLALVLAILLATSLLFGIAAHGVGSALSEGRILIYPVVVLCWTLRVGRSLPGATVNRWLIISILALTTVAIYNLATNGLGNATTLIVDDTGSVRTSRISTSGQALTLALAGTALLNQPRKRPITLILVAAAIVVVLVSQQRSVWIAAAIGVAGSAIFFSGRQRLYSLAAATAAAGVYAIFPATISFISDGLANDGTYQARVNGWQDLIHRSVEAGPSRVLFGAEFGAGFGRFEGPGRYVEFSPHNLYLTIFLRLGLIGLAATIALMATAITATMRRRSFIGLAVLIILIIYGWTYPWIYYTVPYLTFAIDRDTGNKKLKTVAPEPFRAGESWPRK